MTDNVERDVISIISEVSGFDAKEITPETNLASSLEFDSIKSIELVVALEKKYKVSIRDEEIPKITTVKQVIDMTRQLIGKSETD